MPFSVRLDRDTETKIRRLATATRRSKSEVIRDAIAQYGVSDAEIPGKTAFDRLESFVGVVHTGGHDYSRNTHAKYRRLLQQKRHARRPR